MDFNTVLANSVSLIKLGDIHKMKKWHNKFGARVIDPGPYGAGLLTKTYMYVTKNRTHKKTENAANERRSDSTAPTP